VRKTNQKEESYRKTSKPLKELSGDKEDQVVKKSQRIKSQ